MWGGMVGAMTPITRTAPGSPYGSDHSEQIRAAARMVRAAGRRVGASDPADLAELLELRSWVELAIAEAVLQQRQSHSLAEIAADLGVTRQAVHKMHRAAEVTVAELAPAPRS